MSHKPVSFVPHLKMLKMKEKLSIFVPQLKEKRITRLPRRGRGSHEEGLTKGQQEFNERVLDQVKCKNCCCEIFHTHLSQSWWFLP